MAVPRNRHSNARKNSRRAHDALKACQISKCKECGAFAQSHRICGTCGKYKGMVLLVKKGKNGRMKPIKSVDRTVLVEKDT